MKPAPLALLGDVTRILTGYTFRSRIEDDPTGTFRVIQGKDIRSDRSLDTNQLTRIHLPDRSLSASEKWVTPGDILLMTRGDHNYGVLVDASLPPTVTQNSFCTLRVKNQDSLSAAYLATILNQPALQARLKGLRSGSSIPNITLGALRQLEIPVPSIHVQEQITALYHLINRERFLTDQIQRARLRQLDALTTSL